jgi:hypothetical protein
MHDVCSSLDPALESQLCNQSPSGLSLLFEVPSPPLNKLYGSVLGSVAGEKSPYVKLLQKGAEMRNRLVHEPETIVLDVQKRSPSRGCRINGSAST